MTAAHPRLWPQASLSPKEIGLETLVFSTPTSYSQLQALASSCFLLFFWPVHTAAAAKLEPQRGCPSPQLPYLAPVVFPA